MYKNFDKIAKMRERNYVGVTGGASKAEIHHLAQTFHKFWSTTPFGIEHQPMIGILASTKTLLGQTTDNLRYPVIEDIPDLFRAAQGLGFRVVHYNSNELATLSTQLIKLFKMWNLYDENLSRAVQINNAWPRLDQIIEVKKALPDLKIILQISQRAMKDKEGGLLNPEQIAEKVKGYGYMISHVLIDPSGGWGREFDADSVIPIFETVRNKNPYLRLGFGGGFRGDNVIKRCKELANMTGTKNFSIDAEGGLRYTLSHKYGDDLYSPIEVENYLKEAAHFFRK